MTVRYTEEQLNTVDKSLLIQMFLNQQEQLQTLTAEVCSLNEKMQLMMEQMVLANRNRFGRSSEKMTDASQISFMEVDGTIVFFNEAEAVCNLDAPEPEQLEVPTPRPVKKKGKKEQDMSGLPIERIDHYMTEEELTAEFGKNGWKQLPDAISRRYRFVPAKVEVEEYLSVLYDYLHQKLYDYHVIQADETPVLVNHDGRPAGSKSYMWVYRSGYMYPEKQIVLYEYQRTRNASHPREFLKDFSGICVTDGYQIYHTLEKDKEDLTIAGCWVHGRRKFEEALATILAEGKKESVAWLVMKQIQAIYREEGKLKDLLSKERLAQRQVVIRPLVDALFAYLKQKKEQIVVKGKLEAAFTYLLNQEKYLRVFLNDGDVPMDNNASERAIRGFCIGKKNWEVIDTINGAKTSAVIYSIAETAKVNNLKPYEYFEHLLTVIPEHMEDTDRSFLEELLPWSPALPENIRK